jgi:ATP phosphoribosyltransferase regulatory subunit HisZ
MSPTPAKTIPGDYTEFLSGKDTSDSLTRLQLLADAQAQLEADIARREADLQLLRDQHKDLSERQLPDLMDEVGMASFVTRSGASVEINEVVRASIPKALQSQAFRWLRDHNHAAMIKREVKLLFGLGQEEQANKLIQHLTEDLGLEPDDKAAVNAQTLSAFVRGELAEGREVPLDLLGVFRQRAAVIKA